MNSEDLKVDDYQIQKVLDAEHMIVDAILGLTVADAFAALGGVVQLLLTKVPNEQEQALTVWVQAIKEGLKQDEV